MLNGMNRASTRLTIRRSNARTVVYIMDKDQRSKWIVIGAYLFTGLMIGFAWGYGMDDCPDCSLVCPEPDIEPIKQQIENLAVLTLSRGDTELFNTDLGTSGLLD